MIYYKYNGNKGERYFRLNNEVNFPDNEMIIQVCVSPGTAKKGRANCIGVYVIRRITLLANYAFSAQLKRCTKREYTTALKKVLKLIL
jgi:hypothetical protein